MTAGGPGPGPERSQDGAARPPATSLRVQLAAGLGSLAEAWLRDTVLCALALASLVVVVCGLGAADGVAALGMVAGVLAVALPVRAVVTGAGPSRVWLALLAGAVVDGAALAVILTLRP